MKRLIIGGAGFIGVNLAEYFARKGESVVIFDNFSRKGAAENALLLTSTYPSVEVIRGDIRTDFELLKQQINKKVNVVYHLAAQVAVTTSVKDPRTDFEINALGSFNVLEASRAADLPPVVFYSSTNKVYGGMEEIQIVDRGQTYDYEQLPEGVSESNCLDFHSPYGCSKGAADQYFRDYARIFGLRTVVFRQSCIYGERQFGIEDQGWVAWFTIAALLGKPITIFGDGKQVRDVLYIHDLIRAFEMAYEQINLTSGQIYNIGGGRSYTMSLLQLLEFLKTTLNKDIPVGFDDWRAGDQKVYISDCAKAKREFGWEPLISPREGVGRLLAWVQQYRDIVYKMFL
jgi:CDP-paratose 2-epimerase